MSFSRFGDWLASTTMTSLPTVSGRDVDMAFRRALLLSKLYTKSWGHPMTLEGLFKHMKSVMSQRLVVERIREVKTEVQIDEEYVRNGVREVSGRFQSPHAVMFPDQMPGPIQVAHFKGLFPLRERKGLCIHMSGTGDHSYIRRQWFLASGLLKERGIASILLQNPFYGDRKPAVQFRSSLHNVSDLFVMGAALISECNFLVDWTAKQGYGPFAFSGVSMGGYMASLASTNSIRPIGVVPLLSWTTAAPVFTEGILAGSINYPILQSEIEDPCYREKLQAINPQWIEEMYERNKQNQKGLAYNLMVILMNHFTLLSNYPMPLETSLCKAVVAEEDAYVIRTHGAPDFKDVWPGMSVEVMPGVGHVQGYLTGHALFRRTIIEMLDRAETFHK